MAVEEKIYNMNMKIIGTDKKTYSVIRTWDESKPTCVVLELYPTIPIVTDNVFPMDVSALHLLSHINELGDFGSIAIINIYATVFNERPSAKDLNVDNDNLSWIKNFMKEINNEKSTIVLAYGNSLINNRATIDSKIKLLKYMLEKKFVVKNIVVNSYEGEEVCLHPLFLGLRYRNQKWELKEIDLTNLINELQENIKKRGLKKKGKKKDSKSWTVVHGRSSDIMDEHRLKK